MTRLLVKVTEAFELEGRGTVLVPPLEDFTGPGLSLEVELRRPGGHSTRTHARILAEHFHPGGCKWIVHVDLPKVDIPPGTEVWGVE